MSKEIREMINKVKSFKQYINENIKRKEKYFSVTDMSGRSAIPYKLDKTHIEKTWDLTEEDWDTEQTLGDYLEDCYIGDKWSTDWVKFECIAIK